MMAQDPESNSFDSTNRPPQRASECPKAHRTQISGASWSAPELRTELESQVCLQGQSNVPATAEPDHYGAPRVP